MRSPAAVSARAALAVLSLIAARSLARCIVGPGEVVPAMAAAVVGDLTIVGATLAARRSRLAGTALAVLGPIAVLLVPIWIVLGGATTLGWPTFATWHVVASDLSQAWTTFNNLRAPVPELPGFTLAGAWAVGGAALLAGWAADGGDTPLWVVAPPAAIFLFTSALGTSSWRALAITAEVAALGWYAAASRAARREHEVGMAEPVVVAGRHRPRRTLGVAWPAAVSVTIAALLAGFLGPHLPGAGSPALVSLRNDNGLGGPGGDVVVAPTGQLEVNTLVQVAQQEIYQSDASFFLVNTPTPSYLLLTTLDDFDGNAWTSSSQGTPLNSVLPSLSSPLIQAVKVDGGTEAEYETQIQVNQLGGIDVPAPAVPVGGTGPGTLTYDSGHATLVSNLGLQSNMIFDVVSVVPLVSPSLAPATPGPLTPAVQHDLALPGGVPSDIVALAHQIVQGATTDYQKALRLQAYFQSGAFTYQLPKAIAGTGEAVTGGQGLQDLQQFLFHTKTGFCQQFASAFAVLARIDGLPTRIAVGFTPGRLMTMDSYDVTGTDVHAWPQVYLGGVWGWSSFEPTPGAGIPTPPFPVVGGGTGTTTTLPGQGGTSGTVPKIHPRGDVSGSRTGDSGTPTATTQPVQPLAAGGGSGAGVVWLVIAGLLVVTLGAAPVVRLARRRRRARDPAGRVAGAWTDTAGALALVGLYQHDGETFEEMARRVRKTGALPDDACSGLARLARHTTVAAYAPTAPPPEAVLEAIAAAREVRVAARHSVSVWRRSWAAVDPRGVLRSR